MPPPHVKPPPNMKPPPRSRSPAVSVTAGKTHEVSVAFAAGEGFGDVEVVGPDAFVGVEDVEFGEDPDRRIPVRPCAVGATPSGRSTPRLKPIPARRKS